MKTSTLVRQLSILLTAAFLTCKGDPSESGGAHPGSLTLRLTTPNGDDGGVLFTVAGARVDSVTSTFTSVLSRRENTTTQRVVIGGNINNGVLGKIWVPDIERYANYTVTILEVSTRGTYAQRAVAGYKIQIDAP